MANEFVARKGIISLGGLTFPYYPTSVTYTASTDDYFIDVTNTGVTVHLPTVVGIEGKQYVIRNSSTGNTTIDAFSNQRIDGVQTQTLGTSNIMQIVSDGTDQWKISNVGGPVRNSTNNALLTSDGTIGGVDANSYLTFDGKTLSQYQQDTGATYSELYTITLQNITATTTNQIILNVPRLNIINLQCDYRMRKTDPLNTGYIYGRAIHNPWISSTQNNSGSTGGWNFSQATASRLTFSSTGLQTYVMIRTSSGSEIINELDIACTAFKNTEG